MEGALEAKFSGRGRVRVLLGGPVEKTVEGPAGALWTVRIRDSKPARVVAYIQLAEFLVGDREGISREQQEWTARGVRTRQRVVGSLYGIAGKVIDNRRTLLLVDEPVTGENAAATQAEFIRRHSVRTTLFEELAAPAKGVLELLDEGGAPLALGEGTLFAETLDHSALEVRRVEHDVGYPTHGYEDRAYHGGLLFAVDRAGKLAVVNVVGLENLLQGLVPAEIFSRAHLEALKAQAVTARGEVLAKAGLKHLADPYLLCAEQHCAVYRGLGGEAGTTNQAVRATRGEGLFSREGRLVDSVYSAVCGGHTEHNEVVWGGVANPNLRGRPDLLPGQAQEVSTSPLADFLSLKLPAACRLSTFAQPSKFRWERRLAAEDVNQMTRSLGIGNVMAMAVTDRGISGRARLLTLSGTEGATQVRGELNIRKLFGMLNSAMFVVSPERDAQGRLTGWVFRGGGWGHGVGMCQTGAIGRAEAGQTYRDILGHYFSGAEVQSIY